MDYIAICEQPAQSGLGLKAGQSGSSYTAGSAVQSAVPGMISGRR